MLRCTVFLCVLNVYFVVSEQSSKYDGTTLGRVWPRPQMQVNHEDLYTYNPQNFDIVITQEKCALLTEAVSRCKFNLKRLQKIVTKYANNSEVKTGKKNINEPIQKLQVELTNECKEYPRLGMEEAYSLTVSAVSTLKSASIWGIIRGLETFSQLFFFTADYREICVYKTEIHDYPRYSHRGLLIDTSKHFFSLTSIFLIIKALAINKMNVLHWRMTGDERFSYRSDYLYEFKNLNLSRSSMMYTKKDISTVINYARERGVRVIPEFGVPSHTLSWNFAIQNILADCYGNNQKNVTTGIMNPIHVGTYELLGRLFDEVQNVFKDKYLHLGGGEIDFSCWVSNPTIGTYMKENNLSNRDLLAKFFVNIFSLLQSDTVAIVWQDVFDNGVPLNVDTIVQVWKGAGESMLQPMLQGYQVLYSSNWYLNESTNFDEFYRTDPQKMVKDISNKAWITRLVIGGEACMWGGEVDDQNLMTQVWPRTCAVAERLWSNVESHKSFIVPNDVKHRLNEHICHMIRRGIPLNSLKGNGTCLC